MSRCACSDAAREQRRLRQVAAAQLAGQASFIDGDNVLTSAEAAIAGGVILRARDECFRDVANVHATWRKVAETVPAIGMISRFLVEAEVRVWYLDCPVSNSGRLKRILLEHAAEIATTWHVELVPDPDRVLRVANKPIATADSGILDCDCRWMNLARETIERFVPRARVVDLSGSSTV